MLDQHDTRLGRMMVRLRHWRTGRCGFRFGDCQCQVCVLFVMEIGEYWMYKYLERRVWAGGAEMKKGE